MQTKFSTLLGYSRLIIISLTIALSACNSTSDTSAQPDPTTTQPDPTTTQPDPTTAQPDPTTAQPDPTTTQPDPTTAQPDPTTTQPDPTTTQPDPTTTTYWVKSSTDAARFLKQAAFGGNLQEIEALENYEQYLQQQFALPITYLYPKVDPELTGRANWLATSDNANWINGDLTNLWWHTIVNSDDQLRQRIAHVLSEVFVVGKVKQIAKQDFIRIAYYDLLVKNAFGNYRDILTDITMSPVMASYLTMINSRKADPIRGNHPDENYAREVMQLFTVGLVKLNMNGTPALDNKGLAAPTYSQADIEGLANVFTGFTFSKEERFRNYDVINPEAYERRFGTPAEHLIGAYAAPMICIESLHETSEKIIINGTVIPAGQSCMADIKMALDTLFNHDTLPPFFAKQMIQKLVTSNPSEDYILRVANKFVDNGTGVRGDLKAVIRAVLLDNEARSPIGTETNFGKFKEPIIRASTFARIFNISANVEYPKVNAFPTGGQLFLGAPSVFNYFRPDFTVGEDLMKQNLVTPELEIADASNITTINNGYRWLIFNANFSKSSQPTANSLQNRYYINLSHELSIAKNSSAELVDHLNRLLLVGTMTQQHKELLINYMESMEIYASHSELRKNQIYIDRVTHALYIVMSSSAQKYLH
jgi:uncharacterized protein (DUF1800 family)